VQDETDQRELGRETVDAAVSQPPDHDQPAVPAPDSEPQRPDTAPLPLPYDQETWQSLSDQPVSLPPPDEAATRSEELSESATPFGDQPTLPSRMFMPQQKRRPWLWVLWLPPLLVLGVLLALLGLYSLVPAVVQQTSTPTTGSLVRQNTATSSAAKSTPHGSASATARSTQGSGTPGSATMTATATSTATLPPTATPVPGQFGVSPASLQQRCSLVLPLASFLVTLSNQTASSVGYQVRVVTDLPGTSTPWASVSPASGSIPAGAHQQIDVTPNSGLCTDTLFHGTQPFVLRVTTVSGTSGTSTVTDDVSSAA
jgi:hypothetical protein